MKIPILSCIGAMLLIVPSTAEDYLPTPYTAEQIRDAWQVGFEVTTRTQSADGLVFSRTKVLEWSEEGFRMSDRAVSEAGVPTDEEVSYYSGSWAELRDHARFPVAKSSRERVQRDAPLGNLEGWLYRVQGEDSESEFFFADGLPGPPVVYRQIGPDGGGFVAEQVARTP